MKYFVWFLGLLGILFALIFGVILIRNTLRGYRTVRPSTVSVTTLSDKDPATVTVQYTIDGPVVANENHRAIHFSINQSSRMAQVLTGYQGAVMRQQDYGNNANAYSAFLDALDAAGFGRTDTRVNRNATSCATGRTFTMTIIETGQETKNLTTSSCLSSSGDTFGGNVSLVNTLFQRQIPDYRTLTQNMGGIF